MSPAAASRRLLCLLALPGALTFAAQPEGPSPTTDRRVSFVLLIRDSLTGLGVPRAELDALSSARAPAGRSLGVVGPRASVLLAPDERELVVRSPGYSALAFRRGRPAAAPTGPVQGRVAAEPTTVWLDPEAPPSELAAPFVASRLLPGTALLHGHVVDGRTLEPLADVSVRMRSAGLTTRTDERGYFALQATGALPAHTPDALPQTDDLLFEAPGYKAYRLARVALFETDTHFIVDMEPGTGETGRDERHKLLGPHEPQRAAPDVEGSSDIDAGPAPVRPPEAEALVVDPIDSINVQGYGHMSLETYVGNGLNDEWIASWNTAALRAGAVPYRSYGAWYQINNGSICATASCQVYDSDYSISTRLAAQYTSGLLLEKGGVVARSEYSAENNCVRCAAYSCANSDLSCGHGSAGSPAAGWSCLADAHSFSAGPGQCCFGHGRGMCQWGTQAWAGTGSSWAWMVNHYYNDLGAGSGQRTMHMTSPLTVVAATPSPRSVPAGSTFTLDATGRNFAEQAHGQILLRSGLTGPSGNVANGSGERRITLAARTDTMVSVPFAVPGTASPGTYDLVVELWFDVDEDGALDPTDFALDARTFPGAVTVSSPSGCLAPAVPPERWRGEYWANKDLAGAPAMVRDDGAGALAFDWGTGSPGASCGIGAELFSARWTRTASFAAGTYRFTITSDDGFRFYVDGVLTLDKWILQAPTTYTVDVSLAEGSHTLRLDYFENTGLAVAKLSWPSLSVSPPGFDAASSTAGETAELSWAHAVSGTDRLLLVGASIRGNVPVASVTYAGLPLTKIRHDTFGTDVRSEIWYLVAPPVGTQTVTLRLSSVQNVVAGATSWTNVDQTSPLGNRAGANHGGRSGATASVQVASGGDQVVVDIVATQAAAATVTAGVAQTVRWNRQGNHGNGAGSSKPGAAVTTLSWNLARPEFWAMSAVALKPAPSRGGADRITRRVFVLSYDPVNPGNPGERLSDRMGTADVFAHSRRIADAIRDASGGMVDYQIAGTRRNDTFPLKRDGFRYTWDGYLACRADVANCHSPDDASYLPMMNGSDAGSDLCSRLGSGEIDEVWVWGFGWFGIDEFAYKIPNDQPLAPPRPYNYWIYDGRKKDLPVCGRTYFVMGYNHERQEGRGLHSYGHRMESALTASPAAQGLWHRCGSAEGSSDWTDFTCIERDDPGRAGCGDVHFPPNGAQDYDYANPTIVTSQCDDWFNYPNRTGATTNVSAATWGSAPWGSDEDGYLTWWMNHLPRKAGRSERGGATVENNWWHYVLCYDQLCPMTTR